MKKPTRAPKTKTFAPMTMVEFKAWLKGIEDMQPDNWSPTPDQWAVIKQRLDSVIATEGNVQHTGGYDQGLLVEPNLNLYQPPSLVPIQPQPNIETLLTQRSAINPTENGGISGFA